MYRRPMVRKILSVIVFSLVLLMVGRNLTFLPRFDILTDKKNETNNLKKDIESLVKKQAGNYSIYYASFDSDNSFGIHQDQIFTAASVNKIPIIAVLYFLAGKGKINLDEQIALQKDDIADYGTGSLRYQKPGTLYSLRTLVKLALSQSDNTAAHILALKLDPELVKQILDSWGLTQTNIDENKTSLSDMFIIFKKIYAGEVTNASLTKELLGFMQDTDFEDRIALGLPTDTTLSHKTGDGVGIIHDVGIVQTKNTTFFLGVFTSEIGDKEAETKKAIGEITKKIIDFEKNNK